MRLCIGRSRGLFLGDPASKGLDLPLLAGHMYYFSIIFPVSISLGGSMTDEISYLSSGWASKLVLKILIVAKRGGHYCDSKEMKSLPS